MLETAVYLLEAEIHLLETAVHLREPLVDLFEEPGYLLKTPAHLVVQFRCRIAQPTNRAVVILQAALQIGDALFDAGHVPAPSS